MTNKEYIPHAKFQNHSTTPSGRKVCGTEGKKDRKRNHEYSGHIVPQPHHKALHRLRLDQMETFEWHTHEHAKVYTYLKI